MDDFGCDYACRTVGESIARYNIPDDWLAEFDVWDDICPIVCVQIDQIRKNPAILELKLRIVENEDDEYAGCMVLAEEKVIAFKVDCVHDLVKAMENE